MKRGVNSVVNKILEGIAVRDVLEENSGKEKEVELVKDYVKAIQKLIAAINDFDNSLEDFRIGMEKLGIDLDANAAIIDAVDYPGSDGSNISLPAIHEASFEEKRWISRLKKVFPSVDI